MLPWLLSATNAVGATAVQASETWDLTLEPMAAAIECKSQTEGLPTIEWEDVSNVGRPLGEVRIGSLCLGRRILSGSRYTLSPGMLGVWEYDLGFRALAQRYSIARRCPAGSHGPARLSVV